MHRVLLTRALADGAQVTNANQPNEVRCAAAIDNLNEAFKAIHSSAAGLDVVGLGDAAKNSLIFLKERLSLEGTKSADVWSTPSVFMAVPLDLLHDAVCGVHLPNKDAEILRSLRNDPKCKKRNPDDQRRQDEQRLARLQWCTVTLAPNVIRVRNRVDGIEVEAIAPALVDEANLPREGLAFTLPLFILFELFDRTANVPSLVKRSRDHQQKQLIMLRYDPVNGLLQIVYGTAHIRCSVQPLPVPETPLADIALDAPRRSIATTPLADGLRWVLRLGAPAMNVLQEGRHVIGSDGHNLIVFAEDGQDREELVIEARIAQPLASVLRRLQNGANIRTDGGHHFIEKGVITLSFGVAQRDLHDFEEVEQAVTRNGASLTIRDEELLDLLIAAKAIGANRASLELLSGPCPQLKLTAAVSEKDGSTSRVVSYTEVCCSSDPSAIVGQAIEIDVSAWIKLVGPIEHKPVDLIVGEHRSGVLLAHQLNKRNVRTALAVRPVEGAQHQPDSLMIAARESASYRPTMRWVRMREPSRSLPSK
jgi:hypothetical protein